MRRPPAWSWAIVAGIALVLALRYEARTSALQSRLLSSLAAKLSYTIEPGPSPRIVFPEGGPFDRRLGYAKLPAYERRLDAGGYEVVKQARFSPTLARLARWGFSFALAPMCCAVTELPVSGGASETCEGLLYQRSVKSRMTVR